MTLGFVTNRKPKVNVELLIFCLLDIIDKVQPGLSKDYGFKNNISPCAGTFLRRKALTLQKHDRSVLIMMFWGQH